MIKAEPVPVITLDGPSGTGKGTICRLLAEKLGWHFLDSGAIYRTLAYGAIKYKIKNQDLPSLIKLAKNLPLYFSVDQSKEQRVFFDQDDVSTVIRSPECSQRASELAVVPEIRQALLHRQRDYAKLPGLVTDGRDMGTVVFPNASLKIYMDASIEERAKRRHLQLQKEEKNASLAQVIDQIKVRDERDQNRSVAPLRPADDAVLIDTTSLNVVQVMTIVLQLVEKSLCKL